MRQGEYNELKRATDALRAADGAFCENFYSEHPFNENTLVLLRDLLDKLTDLYAISDMIIDNETYRREARRRRRAG